MFRSPLAQASAASLISLAITAAWPTLAAAQTTAPVLQLQQQAQALGQALNALAQQAGLELMVQPSLVQGRTAPALEGSYALQDALARLLSGTGLTAVRSGNLLVVRPIGNGSATLPEVRVQAGQETATGPVYGYVARRSMAAGKDDVPISETPQSISVVTRDQMDDQGAQTVTDALRYVAGVNSSAYGEDARYDWITVRGFNQSVFGMYRDGLRASGSKIGMRIDPYGLERIEVLKGPSSVLYGQNAPGGMVNSVTKRPTAEPLHEVSVGVGSHDRKQAQFDLGGPVSDTVSYRLTGNLREANTQMDHTRDDHLYIAPAITWKPDANTSLTLLANYQKDKASWGLWYLRAGTLNASPWGPTRPSFYPGEPGFNNFDREQYAVSTLLEHRLANGAVFRQNLRAEHMDYQARYVRGRALINAQGRPDENGTLLYRDANTGDLRSNVYAMDNQLGWSWDTAGMQHHFLVGLDTSLTQYRDHQLSGDAPVLDILNPQYGQPIAMPTDPWYRDVMAQQTGVYLQDRINIGERWVLRGGIRHDWARTRTRNPLNPQALDLRQKDSATTLQAGALYHLGGGWSSFANYAESFQPTAQASRDGSAFSPTRGKSVEAGVRFQPEGSRSMLTASLYNIRQNHVLTQDPLDNRFQAQTGAVRSRGLELEGVWAATRQLTLLASYTYLDAKVTESNIPGEVGTRPRDGWGTTSPKHMASLWAQYRFADSALRGVSVGAGARFIGSTTDYGAQPGAQGGTAYDFRAKTPAYTVYDLVLGYEPDAHWRFQFKVNNLFDKLYVANPCGGSAMSACYYGPVRSMLLSGSYRW